MSHRQRTIYLYGFKAYRWSWLWKYLPYTFVLKLKIKFANAQLRELLSVDMWNRDDAHVNACRKAIIFNDDMVKETE